MGKKSEWDKIHLYNDENDCGVYENKLSDKDAKLINYLASHEHMTPFEHCSITLHLKVPLFIRSQIHRHRTFAYNEISRRYVSDNIEFFIPDKWRKKADNVKQGSSDEEFKGYFLNENIDDFDTLPDDAMRKFLAHAVALYTGMLRNGLAPEQARMILPQNLYTEFYMTGNLRNWVHFLKLRLDSHAQQEVRDIAEQCAKIIEPLYPVSYAALMRS